MHVKNILQKSKYELELDSAQWKVFATRTKTDRNFCESCKRKDVQLEVHHISYDRDRKLWEYGRDEVVVLCRACHGKLHEHLGNFRRFVFGKMSPQVFQILNGSLAVAFDTYDPVVFAHALAEFVATPSMVERYAKAWSASSTPKVAEAYHPESPINTSRTKLREAQVAAEAKKQ